MTGICKYIQWIKVDRTFRRNISEEGEGRDSYLRETIEIQTQIR